MFAIQCHQLTDVISCYENCREIIIIFIIDVLKLHNEGLSFSRPPQRLARHLRHQDLPP